MRLDHPANQTAVPVALALALLCWPGLLSRHATDLTGLSRSREASYIPFRESGKQNAMPYRVRFFRKDGLELDANSWKTKEMAVAHAKGHFPIRKNEGATSVVVTDEDTGTVILNLVGETEPEG